ncbi:MAG: hypothetical protein AAF927_20095 [Bacteroidota bacterium]
MNDSLDIKRVFGPIVKYFWLVTLAILFGIAYGQREAKHMLRVYESRATIKLNDQHTALTKFLEHIEAFSVIGKYTVELEVMRSDRILQMAIELMDLPISFYRHADGNWRDQYPATLFQIEGEARFEDQKITLEVLDSTQFRLILPDGTEFMGALGERLSLPQGDLIIQLNQAYLALWRPAERFAFTFNSLEGQMEDFGNGEDLLIRLQDEKVAIVNFYTWDESAQRAADFANALARAYLNDFRETKAINAQGSQNLLIAEMQDAYQKVQLAERELLDYQKANQIENYAPVLSERLDQLGILIQQEMFLSLENKGLQRIEEAFQNDTTLLDPGLTYDVINSETYLNGVRRLRALALTRTRLKRIYQDNHPELDVLDRQIINLRHRIGLSVQNTLNTNQRKIKQYQAENRRVRSLIDQIPGTAREWIQLQRNLKAAEARYENLLEKKAEADISTASEETFHILLEEAIPAHTYLKPNPEIRMGVTGLSFGLLCCFAIHLFLVLSGRVWRLSDLVVHTDLPLLAQQSFLSPEANLISAEAVNLAMKIQLDSLQISLIGVFSASYRENSSLFIFNLAKALSAIGKRAIVIDADLFVSQLSKKWGFEGLPGIKEMVREEADYQAFILKTDLDNVDFISTGSSRHYIPSEILHHQHLGDELLRMIEDYDYVLLNVPSLKQGQEAWPLLKRCDRCLLPVQKGRTARRALGQWERLLALHQVDKAELVYLAPSSKKHNYFTLESHS